MHPADSAIIGRFDGERLTLEEVHRFANGPVALPTAYGTSLYWDAARLYGEVKEGLTKAVAACKHSTGSGLVSVALDAWGVDFGLLDRAGVLLGNPYHYRDNRTDGMLEEAFRRVPREEIFAATGIQFMQINSLYQLLAMIVRHDPALEAADTLLFIPDLLNYWLTGRKVSERSIASTSQCLDPFTGDWTRPLIDRMGIPAAIFPQIVEPGTVLGELLPHIAAETGAEGLTVVAPGCHDTACAVAAVPAENDDYAYLSSGTWSLMGIESSRPVVNSQSLAFNVTNEGGVCDTIRLLKNITGLWVIQECRRTWIQESGPLSWDQIVTMAARAPEFTAFIDVDAQRVRHAGRHARAHLCLLCGRRAARATRPRHGGTRCVRESGADVSPHPGDAGPARRAPKCRAAHRGRRDAKPTPVAVCGKCNRPAGGRGTDRGYSSRQCADADARHRRHRIAGRRPRDHPPLVRYGGIRAARHRRLG